MCSGTYCTTKLVEYRIVNSLTQVQFMEVMLARKDQELTKGLKLWIFKKHHRLCLAILPLF